MGVLLPRDMSRVNNILCVSKITKGTFVSVFALKKRQIDEVTHMLITSILITMQCIHVSKYHIASHKYA